MKIQYWSDLHLEFKENAEYLMQQQIKVIGDMLIIAGDVTYWDNKHFAHPYFDRLSEKFTRVYLIPGNHEFYNGVDISILEQPIKNHIRENIYLVNNLTETIDGVDFIFTTLWSNIRAQNAFFIESNIRDFQLIKYKGRTITAEDYNNFFAQSYQFLNNAISQSKSKRKIVVTHHCPTEKANAKEFLEGELTDAFVSELSDFIYQSSIDFWIFGHTHRNVPMLELNGTKILTNQLGYVYWNEHKSFKMDAFINTAF